jgi:hypothetical protein
MNLPDRRKQRREYLRKKAGAYTRSLGGSLLLLCFYIAAFVCIFYTCIYLMYGVKSFTLLFAFLSCLCGYGCWKLTQFVEKAAQAEAEIPFVPSVSTDTLSAEEVLVRGAQEPIAEQRAMLLRAAEESADAPSKELLRATTAE